MTGLALIVLTLLPTLVYYYTVNTLAQPQGNVDTGAMWGSYLGLLFLGGGFIAIGIFSSSLSENQIVAFILGVFFSFLMYFGIEQVASYDLFGSYDSVVLKLGMFEHYLSISRGVVDTRDLLYFGSLVAFFLMLTKLKLESRKW